MSFFKGSPYRRHTKDNDVGAGGSRSVGDFNEDDEESSSYGSPFDISSTKNASIACLRRWRKATLVLNPSC
ncbi:calcium-transporting ATPase 10, plasma membrane-type [Fagus crenata]